MRLASLAVFALLTLGCEDRGAPLTVVVEERHRALAERALRYLPVEGWTVQVASDPARALGTGTRLRVALVEDPSCAECFRLERAGSAVTVKGGAPLGLQYGLYAALEAAGVRFHHPWRTHRPATLAVPADAPGFGQDEAPAVARRGLHLHILHPVESLYDFWIPGDAALEGALRTVDFLVQNRGNYLQWTALDDIQYDDAKLAAWRAHTRTIIDDAHARGVKVGLGVQLFGKSNLQQAYDLLDGDPPADARALIRQRLALLLDGLRVDNLSLSFGEFFGADPATFVDTVNQVYEVLQEVSPGTEMTGTIHVGNYPDLRVTYQGESLLYYFLVKFADPRIIPWVHSVMYYNLFDDTGGAYLHDQFDEHRAYLQGRLAAGQRVGYHPESAYWIAFDNSLPVYLPLYVRSRWRDLAGLPGLQDHVLFSTGWEWGYWQTDVATLRMSWKTPQDWAEPLVQAFAPWGAQGEAVATELRALGELQHTHLIERRLAAYLAGRDQVIDAGDKLGIFSQPDRPEFDELGGWSQAQRDDFAVRVLANLDLLARGMDSSLQRLQAAGLDATDPFLAEVLDGVEVTALRARFAHQVFQAANEHASGRSAQTQLAQADAALAAARTVVSRRRGLMHEPDLKSILRANQNPTFYDYGYLREADTLCFWARERAQLRNLVLQVGEVVPGCVL